MQPLDLRTRLVILDILKEFLYFRDDQRITEVALQHCNLGAGGDADWRDGCGGNGRMRIDLRHDATISVPAILAVRCSERCRYV
jgi:hypothetical protein